MMEWVPISRPAGEIEDKILYVLQVNQPVQSTLRNGFDLFEVEVVILGNIL